ncbi:hypothetical protein ACFE04_007261 [Oxalis oulophora]
MSYHGGQTLNGQLKLGLVWYGKVGRIQKNTIRSFINSLNVNAGNIRPQVSHWWDMVESYQVTARKRGARIGVRVVKQATDKSYACGKILTKDFIKPLIAKATGGDKSVLTVIFTSRDVTVDGLCMGKCGQHGVLDFQPYIIVGNPETECPEACAWPFVKSKLTPGIPLKPPSGNIGADAMVIAFAQALAETVTNPFNNGIYQGPVMRSVGVAEACHGIFGFGGNPAGKVGKTLVNPRNGGAYNAHGLRGKKFLLPGLWNFQTKCCWTLL